MSKAGARLRARVLPQNRMWWMPTLSLLSTPSRSSAMIRARLSRSPAPRLINSATTPARPGWGFGSRTHPAGTRKLKVADRTWPIRSARRTRPLGKVCWKMLGCTDASLLAIGSRPQRMVVSGEAAHAIPAVAQRQAGDGLVDHARAAEAQAGVQGDGRGVGR